MSTHVLRGVTFDDQSESVVIEYMTPDRDVKRNGICLNHAVMIPALDEFRELLLDLHEACQRALQDSLAAFANADTVDLPSAMDEDDDAPGPYDNPTERDLPS